MADFPTATGLARRTLSPSRIYIFCAEVLMATLTAEGLVGCVTGGSKENALPDELEEGVLQELRTEAPMAKAIAARVFDSFFIRK